MRLRCAAGGVGSLRDRSAQREEEKMGGAPVTVATPFSFMNLHLRQRACSSRTKRKTVLRLQDLSMMRIGQSSSCVHH